MDAHRDVVTFIGLRRHVDELRTDIRDPEAIWTSWVTVKAGTERIVREDIRLVTTLNNLLGRQRRDLVIDLNVEIVERDAEVSK